MTVYVAEQQTSFATQQAMILREVYIRATQQHHSQVIINWTRTKVELVGVMYVVIGFVCP